MEDFIALLMRNLEKNGFPQKRVAFDLEGLYERAEDQRLSLNKVLDELKTRGVEHLKKGDKIIFNAARPTAEQPIPELSGLGPDFLERAQEMMAGMSEEELASTRAMVQERLGSMSPTEREDLFSQLKGMGLG